jgi:hypothetical protein
MKVDRLLSRLKSFTGYMVDPIKREGSLYRGRVTLKGRTVEGWVRRSDGSIPRPPDSVTVTYSGNVIGTIRAFTGDPPEYRFAFDTGFDITAADVLQERFRVFAVNSLGQQFALLPDGRAQVDLIRGTRDRESDVELTIDFSQDGNARPYLREGWHASDRRSTWTQGNFSFMEIPAKEPQANYHIEMHVRAFVVPGKLPSQGLDVYINDSLTSRSGLRGAEDVVKYQVPQDLVVEQTIKLRFDLANAARPTDLVPDSKDKRILGLAFRKLILSRQLEF